MEAVGWMSALRAMRRQLHTLLTLNRSRMTHSGPSSSRPSAWANLPAMHQAFGHLLLDLPLSC